MRSLRRVFAAVLTLAAFAFAAPAQATVPGPLGDLQQQLARLTSRAPGRVGVMVQDLTTGFSTAVNATAEMPAASTIKIPVMVEVFRRLAAGSFDLNRQVTLLASDRDWGWGDLASAPVGTRYSVSNLLRLMITESDNTATNMLIRLVGRQAINATMLDLGLTHTKLGDFIRSKGPIASALRSSPSDMIRLLDAMAHDRLVDEWSSREMIAILSGQHHNTLLPQPLPPGTTVAHKTGQLHDTLNDVGIVYLNDEPYAIAVMTTRLPTLAAGRSFIRSVSRLAYDELARFADWRLSNDLPVLAPSDAAPPTTPDLHTRVPGAGASALPGDATGGTPPT